MDETSPGPGAPSGARDLLGRREAWLLLLALLLVFDAVKLAQLGPANSDENLYFYMGKLVSEGYLPYRDFRFAHPPLRLLPPALVFATVGPVLAALELIPVLCANLTALLIFLLLRRLSAFTSLLAVALFLFSFSGLFLTSYAMGTNLTAALLVLGVYLLSRRWDLGAGAAFGAALATGLYAIPALAAVALHLLATERSRLRRVGAGFAVVAGPIFLACFVIGGDFHRQVVTYQLRKGTGVGLDKQAALLGVAGKEALLLIGLAAYPFFRRGAANVHYLVAAAFVASFLLAPIFQPYYFGLAAPFLAVAAAVTLAGLLGRLPLSPVAAALTAVLLLGAAGARCHTLAAEAHEGESLPQARDMADMARQVVPPGGAIFGMQSVAPLVAMLTDREILDRHLDTDSHAYLTGVADLGGIIEKLETAPPVLLITTHRVVNETTSIFFGPMVDEDFRRMVATRFRVVYTWVNARDPAVRIVFRVPAPLARGEGR